jgi:hypothetical protein
MRSKFTLKEARMGTKFPTEVGAQDTVVIHVTGVKPGSGARGLPTNLVQQTIYLEKLLEEYGNGATDPAEVDLDAMKALGEKDPASFAAEWAKLGEAMTTKKSDALPDQVVGAVCTYLEKEHEVVISREDPGSDVWYVNPDDFQPVVQQHHADGWQWFISLAAPFG